MQQSELALFALAFERALRPLSEALAAVHGGLADLPAELRGASGPWDELETLVAELAVLLERVARERAQVFVFGPPKGGKSTLIEALAAVETGDVALLASYPCVRRVQHGASAAREAQAFDGSQATWLEGLEAQHQLELSHAELAARARAVRAAGRVFDPPRDAPRAWRALVSELPAPALLQGRLELFEFPSLHGPLFASYAEAWIGASDAARAAVFVVRASQLADPGAFDGLDELLEHFARFLLLINWDGPPEADPAALRAALARLLPTDELVGALGSERLPVLLLDLRAAARARREGSEEADCGSRARYADLARFLAATLDGHEHLAALIQSALKRARGLVAEAADFAAGRALDELAARLRAAEERRAAAERCAARRRELAAAGRPRFEREAYFDALRQAFLARLVERARELARGLEPGLVQAIEDWFANGQSLQELLSVGLEPRLYAARAELVRWAGESLREELRGGHSAAPQRASLAGELAGAGLALESLLAASANGLALALAPLRSGALSLLDRASIPIRARLGQKLLWRSGERVRQDLFGPPAAPDHPLTSRAKAQRLGSEARAFLVRSAIERAGTRLDEEARAAARTLDAALQAVFFAELTRALDNARLQRDASLAAAELAAPRASLAELAPACARAERALAELSERFLRAELVPARAAEVRMPEPSAIESAR